MAKINEIEIGGTIYGISDKELSEKIETINTNIQTNADDIDALEEKTSPEVITISNELSEWTRKTSGNSQVIIDVAYGNGIFVAITSKQVAFYSTTGKSWTIKPTAFPSTATHANTGVLVMNAVAYGNGRFVAVGGDETSSSNCYIYYSTDGKSWTGVVNHGITSGALNDIIYTNGRFVGVGMNGTIAYSENGSTWTEIDSGITINLNAVAYGNGRFVAVGGDETLSNMYCSIDNGVTWTSKVGGYMNEHYYDITYGDGVFLLVGHSDTFNFHSMYSENGYDWVVYSSTNTNGENCVLQGVVYFNNQFIAVGYEGTDGTDSSVYYTSSDMSGFWYKRATDFDSSPLYSIIHADNKLIAVGGVSKTDGYGTFGYAEYSTSTETMSGETVFVKRTLPASKTSITLSHSSITEDSLLSFYTSIFGVNPTNVEASSGSVTLTFEAQEVDMEVGVRVDG